MNFGNLLQQAQQMQKRVNKVKKELDEREYDICSQNQIIIGKMKGNLKITELNIDSAMMNTENQEDVETLLIATLNQMIEKINKEREDTLNKVTNGIDVSAFI